MIGMGAGGGLFCSQLRVCRFVQYQAACIIYTCWLVSWILVRSSPFKNLVLIAEQNQKNNQSSHNTYYRMNSNVVDRVVRQEQPKLVKKIKNYIYDPAMVIGSGFSSNVFKGHNEANGQTIAIKVLQLNKIQTEVQKYLLNNEINALRALNHPHVLRTIEILMTKNNVYIMTQFCQNGDLQQLIKQRGKLTEIQALKYIRDVVDGYTAIEDKNIVHRDLKTANIFLTANGARIADFGFCEFLNETKKPQIFYNVGSPAYMSPESYRDNIYSAKSDVWSIGIIFYEMLMGQTPDKNLTYLDMSTNLMAGKIPIGSNEQIRKILAACFKKDIKERISPRELLDAVSKELNRLETKTFSLQQNAQPHNYKSVSPHSNIPNSPAQINYRHGRPLNTVSQFSQGDQSTRRQSPFQTRFGTAMTREEDKKGDRSPLTGDRRFLRQDEARNKQGGAAARIRNLTQMLVFLLRHINYIGESNLQSSSFIRLILFRHRSYLESVVQKIAADQKLDRNVNQPLKNFHYLKSKFDDSYLQKEAQASHSSPPLIQAKLNELSNQPFNDGRSLAIYCALSLEAGKECQKFCMNADSEEISKVGVTWDYLLIQVEIMALYAVGFNVDIILQEYISLGTILKEQPKKLGNSHVQLLKLKQKLVTEQYEKWINQAVDRTIFEESNLGYPVPDSADRKTLQTTFL